MEWVWRRRDLGCERRREFTADVVDFISSGVDVLAAQVREAVAREGGQVRQLQGRGRPVLSYAAQQHQIRKSAAKPTTARARESGGLSVDRAPLQMLDLITSLERRSIWIIDMLIIASLLRSGFH